MKRRVNISFLIIFLLLAKASLSQLEASNWYFGSMCSSLKFSSTNTVSVAPNGYAPFGDEGCSVLSDPHTGALKFYTDGSSVIDATHHIMPNGFGLINLSSSWGSGKIAADPKECNRYYIFHNDATGEGQGQKRLCYTLVDMNLPGNGTVFNPKGDVAPSVKNIVISNNAVEGIEIVPASKSHDFWVLSTSNSPSAVSVYKFTSTGVSLIQSYSLLNQPSDVRAIRFCGGNNKLAIASCNDFDDVLVMDFNTSTGELTNQLIIPSFPAHVNGKGNGVYNVCWSPDGSKLYISKYCQGTSGGKLYQYDFKTASTALIYDVNPNSNKYAAKGLKLGPDGKIYFIYTTPDGQIRFLGGINKPDNAALACDFNPKQINMNADITNANKFPDFLYVSNQLKHYADTVFTITTPCNFTSLEIDMYLPLTSIDIDLDSLNYFIQSIHSTTANASLTPAGIRYKNTAKPPYSDTITIQYCDNYCVKKCNSFRIIIQVYATSTSLNLTDSITSCAQEPILLDAGPLFANYLWSTGETTQKISVTTNGIYKITAHDQNGCTYLDSTVVSFKTKPVVSLGKDTSACDSLRLTLISSFSKILWSTGSTSPSAMIHTSGRYWVTVTNTDGCTASDTISVIVYNPPAINLGGPYNFCQNVPIQMVLKVTGMKDVVWSTGNTQDSIMITSAGTYSVSVTDMKGCKASSQVTITTSPVPVAAFTPLDMCAETSNTFIDLSTITLGKIRKHQWEFGDGSISQFDSISHHAFATAGTFPVKLLVTSDMGCKDSVTHLITVFALPAVDFDYKILCPGTHIQLENNSTSVNPVTFWNWDFGDGTKDSQKNPAHIYITKGDYQVSLTAKTEKGCVATHIKSVHIATTLKADFTTKNNCEGKRILLTDNSSFNESGGINYYWSFGDSTFSTERLPVHTFDKAGTYNIKLLLTSNSGCSDSVFRTIKISPNPKAAFTATNPTGCSPLLTSFTDRSTISTGSIIAWKWQLGIKNSTAQNPELVYRNSSAKPSTHDVKLHVTSDSGCTSEILQPNLLHIYPAPTANFLFSPKIVSLPEAIITIQNSSQGTDSARWDFGDGFISSAFNPSPHHYTNPDTFSISLIVYNNYGCSDTITKKVFVQPDFTFYIPNSFSPNDDQINDNFSGKGEEILEYEMTIYNRFGNIMFHTADMHVLWNGRKNNIAEPAAPDVYVYTITIVDTNRKKHFYKGVVTLIR